MLSRTDIVDIISDFVPLVRKGTRHIGLCPFHDDHHLGNFVVYKNCYKCFACDEKGDVVEFVKKIKGCTFVEAVQYIASKTGSSLEDNQPRTTRSAIIRNTCQLPILTIDFDKYVTPKASHNNNLCKWIASLHWNDKQRERISKVFELYHVGTSKFGHTIFWQIDEQRRVRTGKMMKYLLDGHRDKTNKFSFAWIHNLLLKQGVWKENEYEMQQTLFGMHLVNEYPNAEVHIVESEKTAIICMIYFGDWDNHIWMATGGKSNISRVKFRPLIEGKKIISFHPDYDGLTEWARRCNELNYSKAYISNSLLANHWQKADGDKADLADILTRIINQSSSINDGR